MEITKTQIILNDEEYYILCKAQSIITTIYGETSNKKLGNVAYNAERAMEGILSRGQIFTR